MGTARKLGDIHQDLAQLAEQGKTVGFLANTKNAQRINDLTEDICEVMLDYQVCVPSYSFLLCLMSVLDFIATRYL